MEHNLQVIEQNQLKTRPKILNSELKASIGLPTLPDEIKFKGYELLYADWEFFSRITGGINEIGVSILSLGGGSIGRVKSLNDILIRKIQDQTKRFSTLFSGKNMFSTEVNLLGKLKLDEWGQTITIEGKIWKIFCIEIQDSKTNYKFLPIILDDSKLNYPIEYLQFIKSPLTFYGELRQIPIKLNLGNFDISLQVRAIAHLP